MSEATATAEKEQASQEAPPAENPPTSDAGLSTDATTSQTSTESEAPEATLPDNADDYVKHVLESEGESGQASVAETRRPLVDPVEIARRSGEVKRRFEERQKAYDQLDFDAYNLDTDAGRKRFKDDAKRLLNEHHNDLLTNAGYQATELAWAAIGAEVYETIKALPKPLSESIVGAITQASKETYGGANVPFGEAFRIAAEAARKAGEAEGYRKGLGKGFSDGKKAGESAASGASSGQAVNGNAAPGLRFRSEDALHTAFANKEINAATYASEYKRLTGRDL